MLEGYIYLGNTAQLGEEVVTCFATVINGNVVKVVRGVVLTRAALEDRARHCTLLQEIVKWLPPDLFRTCLARVSEAFAPHTRILKKNAIPPKSLCFPPPRLDSRSCTRCCSRSSSGCRRTCFGPAWRG